MSSSSPPLSVLDVLVTILSPRPCTSVSLWLCSLNLSLSSLCSFNPSFTLYFHVTLLSSF
jgi:hypothetical protein